MAALPAPLSLPLLSGICLGLPDPARRHTSQQKEQRESGKAEQVSYKALLQGPVGAG